MAKLWFLKTSNKNDINIKNKCDEKSEILNTDDWIVIYINKLELEQIIKIKKEDNKIKIVKTILLNMKLKEFLNKIKYKGTIQCFTAKYLKHELYTFVSLDDKIKDMINTEYKVFDNNDDSDNSNNSDSDEDNNNNSDNSDDDSDDSNSDSDSDSDSDSNNSDSDEDNNNSNNSNDNSEDDNNSNSDSDSDNSDDSEDDDNSNSNNSNDLINSDNSYNSKVFDTEHIKNICDEFPNNYKIKGELIPILVIPCDNYKTNFMKHYETCERCVCINNNTLDLRYIYIKYKKLKIIEENKKYKELRLEFDCFHEMDLSVWMKEPKETTIIIYNIDDEKSNYHKNLLINCYII